MVRNFNVFVLNFIFVYLSANLWAEENMLISSYAVSKDTVKVVVNDEFKKTYLRDNFFITYFDEDIDLTKLDYSVQTMPFIMNVISMVWVSGKKYYIESMDRELYESFKIIKKIIKKMYIKLPLKWDGELIPKKLIDNKLIKSMNEDCALTFSAGLDSTYSLLAHSNEKLRLITAWGQNDLPLSQAEIWQTVKNEALKLAQEFGKQTSFLKSNYIEFINWQIVDSISPAISGWRLGTLEGMSISGLVAPLLFSKGIPLLHIAASFTWDYPYATAANPYVDHNLKLCGIKIHHDGFNFTRFDKIKYIVDTCKKNCISKPFLKVCQRDFNKNCCTECPKCLTSCIELILLKEDCKEYGFLMNNNEIIKRAREILNNDKLNWRTISEFTVIQQQLKNMKNKGEKVLDNLEWILSIDFANKIAFDRLHSQKVNWRLDFQEFAACSSIDL